MKIDTEHSANRHWLRPLVVACTLMLALLVWPADAFAGRGHGYGHSKHHGKHHGKGHHVIVGGHHHGHSGYHVSRHRGHHHFEVPRAIHSHYVRTYRPYYYGRTYYAPHRHHHVVYRFPVYGVYEQPVYYPYAYCGDELFARGVFTERGPRFSFGLSIVR